MDAPKSSEKKSPSKVVEGREETKEGGESLKETKVDVENQDSLFEEADYESNFPAIEAAEKRVLRSTSAKKREGKEKEEITVLHWVRRERSACKL